MVRSAVLPEDETGLTSVPDTTLRGPTGQPLFSAELIAVESEDAKLTGTTRSLHRRITALNLPPSAER